MADIMQEAYGAPSNINQLKSFRSDYKQWGGVKFGKNDVKFQIHGPFDHYNRTFLIFIKIRLATVN